MFGRRRRRPPPAADPGAGGDTGAGTSPGPATVEGDRITLADGVHLWCRVVGDGPTTIVVPCSGNSEDFAGLTGDGRRVVFYDVRNRGRSDAVDDLGSCGFGREVADLGAVVEAFELERYSLLGWSYHAGVVADHALSNPDRVGRVVLAAAIAPRSGTSTRPGREPTPAELAHLDQLQAAGVARRDPEAWCRAWRATYVPLLLGDPTAFDRMASPCGLANERPDHVARAMVAVFRELMAYDWRDALGELRVPVLVVHGEEDREPLDSAFEWSSAVADGQVLALPGVGQFPWVERPDEFFAAVTRFLDAGGS